MSRNIRQNIQDHIVGPINADPPGTSATAKRLGELAQAVITSGQRDGDTLTPAWREYATFLLTGLVPGAVADPDDLSRLLPDNDSTGDTAERAQERCYLVANGMCGTGTGAAVLNQGNPTVHLDE
jgi:hypothetical protein